MVDLIWPKTIWFLIALNYDKHPNNWSYGLSTYILIKSPQFFPRLWVWPSPSVCLLLRSMTSGVKRHGPWAGVEAPIVPFGVWEPFSKTWNGHVCYLDVAWKLVPKVMLKYRYPLNPIDTKLYHHHFSVHCIETYSKWAMGNDIKRCTSLH